jgi:hypothetical protein
MLGIFPSRVNIGASNAPENKSTVSSATIERFTFVGAFPANTRTDAGVVDVDSNALNRLKLDFKPAAVAASEQKRSAPSNPPMLPVVRFDVANTMMLSAQATATN